MALVEWVPVLPERGENFVPWRAIFLELEIGRRRRRYGLIRTFKNADRARKCVWWLKNQCKSIPQNVEWDIVSRGGSIYARYVRRKPNEGNDRRASVQSAVRA